MELGTVEPLISVVTVRFFPLLHVHGVEIEVALRVRMRVGGVRVEG
jgi:hypothetical protein